MKQPKNGHFSWNISFFTKGKWVLLPRRRTQTLNQFMLALILDFLFMG